MKKRILACMLIVAMVGIGVVFAVAESTDTISTLTGAPNEETKLTLNWEFNDTKETYTVGFSDVAPAADLNQALASKNAVDTLKIKPFERNDDNMYKGVQDVWVYWDIYTNKAFKIEMSASGPLKFGSISKTDFTNLINWKATWTPCETNVSGQVVEQLVEPLVLGQVDNDFGTLQVASEADYTGAPATTYTDPQVIFNQAEAKNTPMGKKGFAKLAIETQNTRAKELETKHKLAGNYSASLTLKISTT